MWTQAIGFEIKYIISHTKKKKIIIIIISILHWFVGIALGFNNNLCHKSEQLKQLFCLDWKKNTVCL